MSDFIPPRGLRVSSAENSEGCEYAVFFETKSGARNGEWITADPDDVLDVGGDE